jgi:L-ascorbate metabolism protein UlaG (beta-lactamase superfamily)
MNFFHKYNNATVVLNNEFIFDPWLYGSLYHNSWSPDKKTLKKSKLKNIKYCFISHLHQDHWDLDTIKYFPKKTLFILPKLKINKVIEVFLKKSGYSKILYVPLKKFIKIDDKYSISVVRPLNQDSLEAKNKIYKKKYQDIDTGCIIKIKNDNSHHLLLSDNSPYNEKVFFKDYKNLKINSAWVPINGYAQDYPFCYDNILTSEKKRIIKIMNNKRQNFLVKFLKKLKPDLILPYSSTFTLNGKNKRIFYKTIDQNFFEYKDYCNFFSSKFKIKNIKQLEPYQTLYVENNEYKIKSDNSKNIIELKVKNLKNNFPKLSSNYKVKHLENDLNISLKLLKDRIYKYKFNKIKINHTAFFILINKINKIYKIDFQKFYCLEFNGNKNLIINKFKNSLILKVDLDIIANILNRKSHINNCTIGFKLNWERYPKNHYNSELYDTLNFLHK